MHSFICRRTVLLATAVAFIIPFAIPPAAYADGDASTGVGVARISLIEGNVAVQRGDADTPTAAVINAPVLGGDYLNTGAGSRAEVELDGGALIRLGRSVQMRFTRLDNDRRAIQLAAGTIELRLLRGTDGRSDIDTPSISVRPRAGGSYRVSVTSDGRTLVTVRSGDAVIVTPGGEQDLSPGTTLIALGPSSGPSITTTTTIAFDDFDRFNSERDVRYERALADQSNVDGNITGVADLESYGRWVPDQSYGELWVPANVAPGWAPYRDGRWVWEPGFGWTWVGYEPWGWAPYHYGSWYHSPVYGWCWYPPRPAPIVPLWRPALVAFIAFGGGGGSSFGFSSGGLGFNIGWVPLAPYEPWHPWWGPRWGGNTTIINNNTTVVNNNYYGNVNNGMITRIYKNAQYGVTTVPGQRFLQGRFDHPAILKADGLRDVKVVRGPLPVVPTAANLRYSETRVAPQLAMHTAITQRSFAGDTAPVRRVPFEQQRTAIATLTHLPMTTTPVGPHAYAPSGPATTTTTVTKPITATKPTTVTPGIRTTNATGDPWSRFNSTRAVTPVTRSYNASPVTNHEVQVINGTQVVHPYRSDAWNRFNGSSSGGNSTRALESNPSRIVTPNAGAATQRTYDAVPRTVTHPVQQTDTLSRPVRTYDTAPHAVHTFSAPVQPAVPAGPAPHQVRAVSEPPHVRAPEGTHPAPPHVDARAVQH